MKISRAIEIVLELAEGNVMSEEEAEFAGIDTSERDEQELAISIVRNILGALPNTDREA